MAYKKLVVESCETCTHGNKDITQRPCNICIDDYVMRGKEGTRYLERKEVSKIDRIIQWYTRVRKKFTYGKNDNGTRSKE